MNPASPSQSPPLWDQHHTHHHKISARTLGFWLYMLSDSMIYATLFTAYLVLSHRMNGAGAPMGRQVAHPLSALWETLLLFSSALTMGLAMGALKQGHKKALITWLAVTAAFGAGFALLGVHGLLTLIAQGITPERSGYLSAFFFLIIYHVLHIFVGLIWLLVMMAQVALFGFHPNVVYRLLNLKVFWIFQAIIWAFVFSFSYLGASL